ncbi:MAG TPA: hypothetical protein DC049_11820 [Spirochaetia bacterium]|nr:hypothetical protein [Spirochaetia bacterium]
MTDINTQAENNAKNNDFDNTYLYIKGIIDSGGSNNYGLFIIKINKKTAELDSANSIISRFAQFIEGYNCTDPWHKFEDTIINKRFKGDYQINITNDINSAFIKEVNKSIIASALSEADSGDSKIIFEYLHPLLSRLLLDKAFKLAVRYEEINEAEILLHYKEKKQQEAQQKKPSGSAAGEDIFSIQNGVLTGVNLVLAPVSGVPIFSLKAGDEIMVRVDESTEKGKQLSHLYGKHDSEGRARPIKARIEKIIQSGKSEWKILTLLHDGVYGKTIESEQVKVKKPESAVTSPAVQTQAGSKNPAVFIAAALIFAVVAGVLFYYLLS